MSLPLKIEFRNFCFVPLSCLSAFNSLQPNYLTNYDVSRTKKVNPMHRHFHLRSQRCIRAASLCVCVRAVRWCWSIDLHAVVLPFMLIFAPPMATEFHSTVRTLLSNTREELRRIQQRIAQNWTVKWFWSALCKIHWQQFRLIWRRCIDFQIFTRNRISENHFCNFFTFESRPQKPGPIWSDQLARMSWLPNIWKTDYVMRLEIKILFEWMRESQRL